MDAHVFWRGQSWKFCLLFSGFAALPKLPPKTFLGAPQDSQFLENRRRRLLEYLQVHRISLSGSLNF